MFEPWQLAAMDDAGYNGIRDEHIDRVAESLLATSLTEIDRNAFDYHCHKCGIDLNDFTQGDTWFVSKKYQMIRRTLLWQRLLFSVSILFTN